MISLSKTLFIFLCASVHFACNSQEVFKAGASSYNITPNNKDLNEKIVHDSLYAKAIVIFDGTNKIAFITVDNQGIAQYICDEAKNIIEAKTNIPFDNIVISATHTHSGIIANNAPFNIGNKPLNNYQKLLVKGISESAKAANSNLQFAKIGWGSFDKPEHVFNRRWYVENEVVNPFGQKEKVKMNPSFNQKDLIKPAGPIDPEVSFFAIKNLNNEPIAILANYSLHYVGGVGANNISADYYGVFEQKLKKYLNITNPKTPFVGIMTNGTSGDVNNNDYANPNIKLIDYEKINIVANDIASDVVNVYKDLKFYNKLPINISTTYLSLKLRTPSSTISNNIKQITNFKSKGNLYHPQEKYFATRVKNFENIYPKEISIPLQVISIGDLAITTAPFEIFAETGLELKDKSPFKDGFTIGLANGHWGYLPTPNQHNNGGYETWITVNRVQKDASTLIVKKLLKQSKSIKKRIKRFNK